MHLYSIRKPNFDIERVKHGIQLFEGLKDYTTFCADTKNNSISYVRMLDKLTLEKSIPLLPFDPLSQNYEFWNFTFKSKGFLYNQVCNNKYTLIFYYTYIILYNNKGVIAIFQYVEIFYCNIRTFL